MARAMEREFSGAVAREPAASARVIEGGSVIEAAAGLAAIVLTILALHESDKTRSLFRASMAVLVPLAVLLVTFAVGYGALLFWALRNAKPA